MPKGDPENSKIPETLVRYAATDADGVKLANRDQRAPGGQQQRSFEIRAEWDGEAGVWWCCNDELPLTTEAPTFEQLVSCALKIAPEIAAENGLAEPGDEIELHMIAERLQRGPVAPLA